MSLFYRRLIQFTLFLLLLGVGAWIRISVPTNDYPPESDAQTALVIATQVEPLRSSHWQVSGLEVASMPQQILVASISGFKKNVLDFRDYCFLPIFLSVILLLLFPCLGWRKHGGVFASMDGPLWAMAFAVFSPIAFMGAASLSPFTFQCVVFLLILLAARSYAQWPGYLSSLSIGILIAGAMIISPEFLCFLLLFLISILVGVGWTRLVLYWRFKHIIAMICGVVALLLPAIFLDLVGNFSLPIFTHDFDAFVTSIQKLVMLACTYGIGILAWMGVLVLIYFNRNLRWERVLAILFLGCFVCASVFEGEASFVFVVPIVVLTPILVALVVTNCKTTTLRWWLGNIILVGLCLGLVTTMRISSHPLHLQDNFHANFTSVLNAASQKVKYDIRIDEDDDACAAQLLWVIRRHASGKHLIRDNRILDDTSILITRVNSKSYQKLTKNEMYHVAFTFSLGLNQVRDYAVFVRVDGERS